MTHPSLSNPPTFLTRLLRWLPWLILAAALLWLAFLADPIANFFLDEPQPKIVRKVARFFSKIGDCPVLFLVSLAIAAVGIVMRRRWGRIVCLILLAASLSGVTANICRSLTGRTRPSATISQGWYGPVHGEKWQLSRHERNSFPSAHTSTAMAFFVALLLLAPQVGWWLIPMPFLVGLSRILQGAHHFSDVCAGLILGTLVAFVTCRWIAPRWPAFVRWWRSLPLPDLPTAEPVR